MRFAGRWTLAPDDLLASSRGRGWKGLGAELRRHGAGDVPEMANDCTVVGVAVSGNPDSVIHRRGDGVTQAAAAGTDAVWLCPQGVAEDSIRVSGPIPRMLHVYLPPAPFAALTREDGWPEIDASSIRYEAGLRDDLIAQLAAAVAGELARETSSGRLLVETAALTLAARLLQRHAACRTPPARPAGALDGRRLRRVTDFVEAHLDEDVSVETMAAVACLSPFHFARAFKAATGVPPHRFVARRRLERAKALLSRWDVPLTDVALAARFSSQASFTRAFHRTVGVPPGEYRRRTRSDAGG